MSTVYQCSTPEPFGFDYDATDFDLEILDDLELLQDITGGQLICLFKIFLQPTTYDLHLFIYSSR